MQYLKCTLKHFNGFYCLRIIFIWGQSFPFEIVLRKVDDAKFESLTLFHFHLDKEDWKNCINIYYCIHDSNTIYMSMRYQSIISKFHQNINKMQSAKNLMKMWCIETHKWFVRKQDVLCVDDKRKARQFLSGNYFSIIHRPMCFVSPFN